MKKKLLLIIVAVLLPIVSISAFDVCIGGICYDLYGGQAKVTHGDVDGYYTGNIVIPSYIVYLDATYPVMSIEDEAFFGCKDLKSVTLPNSNSFIAIGHYAFSHCTSLTSITCWLN